MAGRQGLKIGVAQSRRHVIMIIKINNAMKGEDEMKSLITVLAILAGAVGAMAQEVTYSGAIAELVAKRCVGCHGADSPEYPAFKKEKDAYVKKGVGPRMDTYAHLVYYTAWPDTGALMRRLDDGGGVPGGKVGNMYRYLGDREEERAANLSLFRAWVGNWTLKRFPEITKEELAEIRVEY